METESYSTHRPLGIKDALLFYTLGGEGILSTPNSEKRTVKGDLAFLKSHVPHRYGTVKGNTWNFLWVHVPDSERYFHLPTEEIAIRPVENMPDHKRIYRTFQIILQDAREQEGLWRELCENSIQHLLLMLDAGKQRRTDARVEHALRLISQRMREPLRVADLAAAVNLSESRLSHLFKEETGESIITTVNKMRIKQASLYIAHTGRTATQASFDVGFQNYNHFAALFRQYMGVSPGAYASRAEVQQHEQPGDGV